MELEKEVKAKRQEDTSNIVNKVDIEKIPEALSKLKDASYLSLKNLYLSLIDSIDIGTNEIEVKLNYGIFLEDISKTLIHSIFINRL